MKLASGTTNTVTAEFNLKELSDIILVCKKSGVQCLELGPVKVTFQGLQSNADLPKILSTLPVSTEIERPKVELTEVDKQMLEDARQAQLMLDDPSAFEQEIIDAHMRDGSVDGQVQN